MDRPNNTSDVSKVAMTAAPDSSATSPLQSEQENYPELCELLGRLELVRAALRMGCDEFEGERARALDVVNQAIKDVQLAIESNRGWSVVRLEL